MIPRVKSWVRPLWDLRWEDAREAGGKAVGLARLMDLGVEVPPGFVVPASFFLEVRSQDPQEPEAEALADRLPEPLAGEIEAALEALGSSPAGYAVRSSAAEEDSRHASFAGIHESYLGVGRRDVLRHIFRCWASAFSERAAAYRRRMGLSTPPAEIRMGVVVQRMLRPAASGVVFTKDPESDDQALRIQAVEGLGEKLVQGRVVPASLRVPRTGEAAFRPPEGALPIGASELKELVEIALRLEAAWGCPLDLEWALESGRLHFLQARPVTRAAPGELFAAGGEAEVPPEEDILWTRANLRELLPEVPSPLFVSLTEGIDWAANSRRLGMRLRPGDRVIRFIEGRPYFSLSLIGRWAAEFGFPISHFTRALGHDAELSALPSAKARPFRAFLRSPWKVLRVNLIQASAPRRLRRFMAGAKEEAKRLRGRSPSALSDQELRGMLRRFTGYGTEFILHMQIAFNRVSGSLFLVDSLIPEEIDREAFLSAVLPAGEKSISVRQGTDLVDLSRQARAEPAVADYLKKDAGDFTDFEKALEHTAFLAAFRKYLEEYGHRGVHESDPAMPVYAEQPGFLLKALAALVPSPDPPDPEHTFRRQGLCAKSAWEDLQGRLKSSRRRAPWRIPLLRRCVQGLKEAMLQREQARFEGMRVHAELRRFLREAGGRLQLRGILESAADVPFLRIEEIDGALSGGPEAEEAKRRVRQRRSERERQLAIEMPNLLRESEIARLAQRGPAPAGEAGFFQGIPVGPGRAEGRAVVLESPEQLGRVARGDILVTPTLDPSWVPLFTLVSGLVVELGGTLSHGSIVAREYGLPAVVNVPGITRILKTGDRVLVDGSAGTIRRLQPDS
jgi:rifampicin phosphotransferase